MPGVETVYKKHGVNRKGPDLKQSNIFCKTFGKKRAVIWIWISFVLRPWVCTNHSTFTEIPRNEKLCWRNAYRNYVKQSITHSHSLTSSSTRGSTTRFSPFDVINSEDKPALYTSWFYNNPRRLITIRSNIREDYVRMQELFIPVIQRRRIYLLIGDLWSWGFTTWILATNKKTRIISKW